MPQEPKKWQQISILGFFEKKKFEVNTQKEKNSRFSMQHFKNPPK